MPARLILAMFATLAVAMFAAPFPAAARCGAKVVLYAAHWCPYCKKTESFLAANGVRYQRIEVADNPLAQRAMRTRFGTTSVPVVIVDGKHVVGFDERWLRRALCLR